MFLCNPCQFLISVCSPFAFCNWSLFTNILLPLLLPYPIHTKTHTPSISSSLHIRQIWLQCFHLSFTLWPSFDKFCKLPACFLQAIIFCQHLAHPLLLLPFPKHTHTFNFFISVRSDCSVFISLSCCDLVVISFVCSLFAFCRRSFSANI